MNSTICFFTSRTEIDMDQKHRLHSTLNNKGLHAEISWTQLSLTEFYTSMTRWQSMAFWRRPGHQTLRCRKVTSFLPKTGQKKFLGINYQTKVTFFQFRTKLSFGTYNHHPVTWSIYETNHYSFWTGGIPLALLLNKFGFLTSWPIQRGI